LTGVVKDPSGAPVVGASVTAERSARVSSKETTTDSQGRLGFADLPAGAWHVRVTQAGFENWEGAVTLAAKPVELAISLSLEIVNTSVQVSGHRSPLVNSDENYRALAEPIQSPQEAC
jgi:hypothetical protein